MATKYNIDINNARPNGNKLTTGVYIGNGSGNRESFYGVRGTGTGSTVIYDKVLYTLEMTNATGLEPSAGRYYASSYASTNKRKHGNGVEETGMALKITSSSQAYIDIPANTSTSSTQTTAAQTVTQYDDSSEHLAYDGAQVTNWTLTQKKNYPTGITLTLSTPTDIAANGGSVNSVTYTAKAQMKAGNEVDVTSDTACTITWTGVTGNNLTTTIKNRTNLGNLTGKVTYVCNGATVTATASVAVYQAENKVTAVAATCGTFAYSTFAAAGGSAVPSTNNANTFVVTYSSTSTSTTAPASTYGTWAASVAYSMTAGNGFTLGSTTTGSVTAAGRGTTTGDARTSNTITKKYDISWTPNASYPGTTRTSSNSKTTTASQEANAITSYDAPTGLSLSAPADIPASGGTRTAGVAGTCSQVRHYTSTSTDTIYPTATYTAPSETASSLGTTAKARTKISTKSMTYTANGKSSTTNNVDFYQEANAVVSTTWNNPVVTAVVFATKDSSAGAATRSTNASATQSGTNTYTSTASAATSNTSFTWAISSDNANAVITNGTTTTPTLTWVENTGTTERSATITTQATGAGSKSASATSTAKQSGHAAYYVKVTGHSTSAENTGGTQSLTIDANTSWTLTSADASKAHFGGSATKTGTGSGSATLTITNNTGTTSRSVKITVTPGAGTATPTDWTITQKTTPTVDSIGASFSAVTGVTVTGYATTATTGGQSTTVEVKSSATSWTLTSDSYPWLSFNGSMVSQTPGTSAVTGGVGTTSPYVTVLTNTGASRTGTITVTSNYGECSPTGWTLTQEGSSGPVEKWGEIQVHYMVPDGQFGHVTKYGSDFTFTESNYIATNRALASLDITVTPKNGGEAGDSSTWTTDDNLAFETIGRGALPQVNMFDTSIRIMIPVKYKESIGPSEEQYLYIVKCGGYLQMDPSTQGGGNLKINACILHGSSFVETLENGEYTECTINDYDCEITVQNGY